MYCTPRGRVEHSQYTSRGMCTTREMRLGMDKGVNRIERKATGVLGVRCVAYEHRLRTGMLSRCESLVKESRCLRAICGMGVYAEADSSKLGA